MLPSVGVRARMLVRTGAGMKTSHLNPDRILWSELQFFSESSAVMN